MLARLIDQPQIFDFFQAVRLIKKDLQSKSRGGILIFKSHPSLVFPTSDIVNFDFACPEDSLVVQFTFSTSFLGLTGQNSILPDHYTEVLLERTGQKDLSMQAFLDIFHHRMIGWFYEVWEQGRFFVQYERNPEKALNKGVLGFIKSISAQSPIRSSAIYDDELAIFYSGLLSFRARSAEALRIILSDHFELPVEINLFFPEWIEIDQKGNAQKLGVDAILGGRACYSQNHFEIQIGPVDYEEYLQLLPSGERLKKIKAIAKSFIGQEFDFHIKVILNKSEIPACEITKKRLMRLGWNSFMKSLGASFAQLPVVNRDVAVCPYDSIF